MILDKLRLKLVEYQKAGELFKLGALRYLLSQIQKKEIELRPQKIQLSDEHIAKVVKKQLKDRRATLEMFEKAKRQDLVEKENLEIAFLQEIAEEYNLDVQ